MAQVLSLPPQPDGASYFGSSSLQRSTSHSCLLLQSSSLYSNSSNHQRPSCSQLGYDNRSSTSLPSSAPSSPLLSQLRSSNQPSYTSTPSSSLSLDEDCSIDDKDIQFPCYSDDVSLEQGPAPEPPNSPEDSTCHVAVPLKNVLPLTRPPDTKAAKRRRPSCSAGDDMKIESIPTRHVDYLSHNWKEEDIWSSWRHIVARRKSYSNSTRLENASWRSWAKSKYRLKTVSPETLNWYI
ncbi:MAG: hypothetical protein L6R39_006112 [Caloplaca ligustica]|nr:MAG: hypothetical protein L6R39_006112 [Caloplaca ligustica]